MSVELFYWMRCCDWRMEDEGGEGIRLLVVRGYVMEG